MMRPVGPVGLMGFMRLMGLMGLMELAEHQFPASFRASTGLLVVMKSTPA